LTKVFKKKEEKLSNKKEIIKEMGDFRGLFVKDLYTHSFVVNRRFLALCMLNVFVQFLF
jgi:hypothetical protein